MIFIDACVLVGALRRHLVISFALNGLFYPRWSERVLMETGHAHARILSGKPNRDGAGEASRLVTSLQAIFPQANIYDHEFENIELNTALPDRDDAHVIQAAIASQSDMILTENMKDFPRSVLKPFGLYARPGHEFFASLINRHPELSFKAIKDMQARLQLTSPKLGAALKASRLGSLAKKLKLD